MASSDLSTLREHALALSETERANLAHDLVASLDGAAEAGAAEAWDTEIVRRINEIDSGQTDLLDPLEVIKGIRDRVS